jgi:hypothetical protein
MARQMSSRERMLAAISREDVDYTPCSFMLFFGLYATCRTELDFVQRQVEMHKEFFKKSGTFWEKYGGVFLLIVIALILFLVVYLSYDFVNEVIKMTLGKVDSVTGALNTIADKMGVAKPPS